ncbi:MAG: AgmX/PglI C-terminal domain-containing protein, partial [Polyangiaceae bacterium]|nr:AgmX/PglI C-terminal domain-containing protein [Polyangiaceae bacterium]
DTGNRLVAHYVAAQSVEQEPSPSAPTSDARAEGISARAERGAAGDPRAPTSQRRLALRGSADPSEQRLGRAEPVRAERAGVLGVLAGMQAFAGPSSPYAASSAIGADPMAALGAVLGSSPGDSRGLYGLGLAGTGAGADRGASDTIGIGRFGTVGGTSYRSSSVGCEGGLCERASRTPPGVRHGTPERRGALAADVIRRVVSRHRAEIRFCYEQGLQRRPDLAGRVVARFIISPTGAVTTSVASGDLGDASVEQCVAQAVRRWSFPAPEDGGVVSVSYPFVMRSGG